MWDEIRENINAISCLSQTILDLFSINFQNEKLLAIKCNTKNIKRVGVFVNSDEKTIYNMVKTNSLNLVQLHGEESPKLCRKLKKIFKSN